MTKDFAIQSSRVLLPHGIKPATVFVQGGKISVVLPGVQPVSGMTLLNVGDLVIMPGIVDSHAHINEPGRTEWEGFETATRAAAAGGITTVIDMPLNSIPATTTLEALEIKAASAKGKCAIDYGFWGGLVPENARSPEILQAMIDAGVMGFKAFLIDSGVAEFPKCTEADLRSGMKILAKTGVPLIVHAELKSPVTNTGSEEDPRSYDAYLLSRPPKWEVDAIRMMIRLARETECPVHIVHLSTAEGVAEITAARAEGLAISVETCPHYLTFASEDIKAGATRFKCAPPIRETENRERLWRAIASGKIQMIVSDHSPCTPELKEAETGNFSKAWGGISGIQFSLPVVWTEMKKRKLALEQLSSWMSANTAYLTGLARQKGKIAQGMDADLVIFNPDEMYKLTREMIRHRHTITPYENRILYGKVLKTFVRGECVYDSTTPINNTTGLRLPRVQKDLSPMAKLKSPERKT